MPCHLQKGEEPTCLSAHIVSLLAVVKVKNRRRHWAMMWTLTGCWRILLCQQLVRIKSLNNVRFWFVHMSRCFRVILHQEHRMLTV